MGEVKQQLKPEKNIKLKPSHISLSHLKHLPRGSNAQKYGED